MVTESFDALLSEMSITSDILTTSDNLAQVLQRLAARARELTGADFAAISTFDEQGSLTRFIYAGISEQDARRLGNPPVGRGLLGPLAQLDRQLHIADLQADLRFTGWPEGHPDMVEFIGVPIIAGGRTIGSFYVTRARGRPPFPREADLAAAVLALQAAVSVASTLERERRGRVFLLEERERIAHDLHDGMIQSLYALGLELDAALGESALGDDTRAQLGRSVEHINQLIAAIRDYIAMLASEDDGGPPELSRDLALAVRQLVPPNVATVVSVAAAALQGFSARQAEDVLYITREALSNAVRHGAATKVAVDLRVANGATALTIQDNGVGYDPALVRPGLGTASARNRAERLGGELMMLGIPGMGATVRLTIPFAPKEPEDDH